MAESDTTCPANREKVIDLYFMEHRAKLIDIAAFLDRVDRAASNSNDSNSDKDDFRITALMQAIDILSDGEPQRTKRILDSFSDPTDKPIESAAGMKGALGVYPGTLGHGEGP